MVVGHIAFSPVSCIINENFRGYILAPLAVHPHCQKRKIGCRLVEAGIQHLLKANVDIVFVYGDPEFYGRFGFDGDTASHYTPPYKLRYSFGWQAKLLTDANKFSSKGQLSCVSSLKDPELW